MDKSNRNPLETLTQRIASIFNKNLKTAAALLLIVLFVAATAAQAQEKRAKHGAAKQDTDAAMLETLKAMQKELGEIKNLLAARPVQPSPQNAPAAVKQEVALDLTNRPFRGKPDAPLTIVEITDYQCPFCARHVRDTMPQIAKDYIDAGKAKYYVIDLPLESIHSNAFKAAAATRCAGEAGKYWESHDWLFANQKTLTDWNAQAAAIGLDAEKFTACVTSDKYTEAVRKDIALAQSIGVQGTPGFYFAAGSGAKIKTATFMNGARPFPVIKEQLDALLTPPKKQTPAAKSAKEE